MQKQASPLTVVVAIVVLVVVIAVIYKLTLGKKAGPPPAEAQEAAPGVPSGVSPQQYQQQMEKTSPGGSQGGR